MNSSTTIERKERILGGLWGALVGDALGVPLEFQSRQEVQSNPAKGMREYGTHDQPKGTWSDDGALILCTVDSLLRCEFDTEDMGKRFVAWYQNGLWTARGNVFDVGIATSQALARIAQGMRAEVAGGDGQFNNGNGSLMRILPVALRFAGKPTKLLLDRVHRASAITHRHPRSQIACGLYSLVIRELLAGSLPREAFKKGLNAFRAVYEPDPYWAVELDYFQLLLAGDLVTRPELEIDSGGYVIHTLTASLWCLLTTSNYQECVLKAVNLGGDTDTTGCVAGGLAGVAYGVQAIPAEWMNGRRRILAEPTKATNIGDAVAPALTGLYEDKT
jgi:ADP-ribosylglycohydrolase